MTTAYDFAKEQLKDFTDFPTASKIIKLMQDYADLQSGWHDIKKEVPDLEISVLGLDIKNGWMDIIDIQEIEGMICICCNNGYSLISDSRYTHWMKLPEPPVK